MPEPADALHTFAAGARAGRSDGWGGTADPLPMLAFSSSLLDHRRGVMFSASWNKVERAGHRTLGGLGL